MNKDCNVQWPQVISPDNVLPFVGWIDLANGTMFRMMAWFIPPFNRFPRNGFWVSIERVGSFLFSIPEKPLSPAYVGQKLFLTGSDANAMTDWINAQFGFKDDRQFGEYREDYILEVEPYGLIGENKIMPLVPEIIE